MITFQSNVNNDLVVSSAKSLSLIGGVESVAQTARQHMQARRLEMFLAADRGMPFDPLAWSGAPNVAQFEAAGRVTLLQVPDVIGVPSFTAQLDGDTLSYIAVIQTIYGEATISGSL